MSGLTVERRGLVRRTLSIGLLLPLPLDDESEVYDVDDERERLLLRVETPVFPGLLLSLLSPLRPLRLPSFPERARSPSLDLLLCLLWDASEE